MIRVGRTVHFFPSERQQTGYTKVQPHINSDCRPVFWRRSYLQCLLQFLWFRAYFLIVVLGLEQCLFDNWSFVGILRRWDSARFILFLGCWWCICLLSCSLCLGGLRCHVWSIANIICLGCSSRDRSVKLCGSLFAEGGRWTAKLAVRLGLIWLRLLSTPSSTNQIIKQKIWHKYILILFSIIPLAHIPSTFLFLAFSSE